MSEKFNQRSVAFSPLSSKPVRTNPNSNHGRAQKNHDKEPEVTALNLALVGSPAPRCQVRTSISTNSISKPKIKSTQLSKVKENDKQNLSMNKLYQFADNPTKYVQRKVNDHLKLNLEYSDRSNESDSYYDSHDIAFGQNGEYRISEYDHIRYLEFNKTETYDDNSSSRKQDSLETSILQKHEQSFNLPDSTNDDEHHEMNGKEIISTFNSISKINTPIRNCNSEPIKTKTSSTLEINLHKSRHSSDSLDCATKYKNTINPMVEKYMLDTGQCASDVSYKVLTNNLCDTSLLSKHFVQAVQLQSIDVSNQNSSRTTPETSRTILSGTSSNDGTWHQHSLNSSYFVSPNVDILRHQNACTLSNSSIKDLSEYVKVEKVSCEKEVQSEEMHVNEEDDGSVTIDIDQNTFEEEKEQYLTVIKDIEEDCEKNIHPYIFITDKAIDVQTVEHSQSFIQNCSTKLDEVASYDVFVSNEDNKLKETLIADEILRINNVVLNNEKRNSENHKEFTSNRNTDFNIGNIFTDDTNSSTSGNSSLLSNMQIIDNSPISSSIIENSNVFKEQTYDYDRENTASARTKSNLQYGKEVSHETNIFYMTIDEINAAAEYSSKLSEIFKNVTERFERPNTDALPFKTVDYKTFSNGIRSLSTPKLVHSCLQSPNFRMSHSST